MNRLSLIMFFLFSIPCTISFAQNDQSTDLYRYSGRIEKLSNNQIKLIGSASSVTFQFSGDVCTIILSVDTPKQYNYVSVELDGKYIGRIRVEAGEAKEYPLVATQKKPFHTVVIYKATEPSTGGVIFHEAKADQIQALQQQSKKKVEFIGDSVFCGQGIDLIAINCGTEKYWFDQHNAYWTYPVISSKVLNYDVQISAVSGVGIYRNWNTEANQKAAMPYVYENLYLDGDASKPYDFGFKPDIIVIGLGNNDFYEGDNKVNRAAFDSQLFIKSYINFMQSLVQHNPKASFVLVTPLLNESKLKIANVCMSKIKDAFSDNKVEIFAFKPMEMHGCYEHPDTKDSKILTRQFIDFMKKFDE